MKFMSLYIDAIDIYPQNKERKTNFLYIIKKRNDVTFYPIFNKCDNDLSFTYTFNIHF